MSTKRELTPAAAARLLRGYSQADLAVLMGTTQATVSHLESGRHFPRAMTRRVHAETLGFRERDIWPGPGQSVAPEIAAILAGGAVGRRRTPRRPRLTAEQVAEMAAEKGLSTEPSDEFGGYSEAEANAAYSRMDPASFRLLTIDGVRERPPAWFVRAALKAQRNPAVRRAAQGGRPRARRTTKRVRESRDAPDDPPLARPRRGARP